MQGNNIEKLIATLATPFQSLENMLQDLLTLRSIDTATGAQLDVIGKIVGQARNGLNDDDYRRYCRARIATNKSDGTIQNVINITELIVYDDAGYYQIANQAYATVVVRIENIGITEALADILITFLKETVSAGVHVILEYNSAPAGRGFRWDTPGRGWDSGCPFYDAKS